MTGKPSTDECLEVLGLARGATYVAYFVVATFDKLVPVGIPGLGLVLVLVLVTLVGFMTSNVIGRAVVDAAERYASTSQSKAYPDDVRRFLIIH